MTEPVPQNVKYAIGMVWIALVTAIIVTIVDWKIKEDIRRLADVFYKTYPYPEETEKESHGTRKGKEKSAPVVRHSPSNTVSSDDSMDSHTGVETTDASNEAESMDNQPTEADWNRWNEAIAEPEPRGSEDSREVQT